MDNCTFLLIGVVFIIFVLTTVITLGVFLATMGTHRKEYVLIPTIHIDDSSHNNDGVVNIKSGRIYLGLNHEQILVDKNLTSTDNITEGYITSYCRFVDKKHAAEIALSGGQIYQLDCNDILEPKHFMYEPK